MSASLLKLAVFKDVGFMDAGYHQDLAFCPPDFQFPLSNLGHDQKPKTEHTYPDRLSPRRVPHDQATRLPGPYWDHRNSKRVIPHHEPRPIVGFLLPRYFRYATRVVPRLCWLHEDCPLPLPGIAPLIYRAIAWRIALPSQSHRLRMPKLQARLADNCPPLPYISPKLATLSLRMRADPQES